MRREAAVRHAAPAVRRATAEEVPAAEAAADAEAAVSNKD
jgi:hypothetical protein